jgi:hypothetical protein
VSTMETMGMLATIGLVAYGGIKLYQLSTKKLPKPTNDKLDEMEKRINEKFDKLEKDNAELSKKIEDIHLELFSKIEDVHTSLYYIGARIDDSVIKVEGNVIMSQKAYADINLEHLTGVGSYLNQLDTQIRDLKVLILANRNYFNKADLVAHLENLEGLIVKSNEIHKKSISLFNLSDADIAEFEILQQELNSELNTSNNILSNLSLRSHNYFDPLNHSMRVYRENTFRNNRSVIDGLAGQTPIVKARSLSDTNILYTSVDTLTSTPREISTGIINRATIRAFHVGPETIINVIRDQLSSILQGSITYTAFVSVLQALGVIGEIPSNSENIGRIISRNIKEFISRISNK